MGLREIFRGISQKMLVDFDSIQAQVAHPGERGAQREQAVREFHARYLPKKYSVATTQIADRQGGVSRQCGVVIYDAFNCPLLLGGDDYQIFPAESVRAVVEVKSVCSPSTLRDAADNIASVRRPHREAPIVGCILASRSGYEGEPRQRVTAAASALRIINNDIPPRLRIDLLATLKDGVITNWKNPADWGVLRERSHCVRRGGSHDSPAIPALAHDVARRTDLLRTITRALRCTGLPWPGG